MTRVSCISPSYNTSKYLDGFLKSVAAQTHTDLEVVLDHNDPTKEEVAKVEKHNETEDNITHIVVEGVDPIGVSMNRCIEYADGDYLCIWNIDDLRTPDSIEVMAKALDENPDVDFVYGNYIIVNKFETEEGKLVDEAGREDVLMNGMILGPFFMVRRTLLDKTGWFDEQLKSGADFDLAMRMARCGKGMHIPDVLGYYLDEGLGQSTRPNGRQPLERTVIELRYNLNDGKVIEPKLVPQARSEYEINKITFNDRVIEASDFNES